MSYTERSSRRSPSLGPPSRALVIKKGAELLGSGQLVLLRVGLLTRTCRTADAGGFCAC
jgi:hypothetical protein